RGSPARYPAATGVDAPELLLKCTGSSGLLLLTLAPLTIVLPVLAVTLTTTVSVTLWPLPSVPTFQLTVPTPPPFGVVRVPTVGLMLARRKEVPEGSESVITTPCAGCGPRFRTTIV